MYANVRKVRSRNGRNAATLSCTLWNRVQAFADVD
jgi:hypothetical protein